MQMVKTAQKAKEQVEKEREEEMKKREKERKEREKKHEEQRKTLSQKLDVRSKYCVSMGLMVLITELSFLPKKPKSITIRVVHARNRLRVPKAKT